MTYPAIPDGRPRMQPDLAAEVARLQRQVAELTRTGPVPVPYTPICTVRLTVNVPLGAGANTWAQGNWSPAAGDDPDGCFTSSAVSGTYSYMTVPRDGRYLVGVGGQFASVPSGATCVAYMAKNAVDLNASLVRDARNTTNQGGDGVTCWGLRPRYLRKGDILYWGHWGSGTCTLNSSTLNVPTEVTLIWMGTR
jgi:hypothetical protein